MQRGYLYVQTRPDRPARVRVLSSETRPDTADNTPDIRIRYIAWFGDLNTALMHFYQRQRRRVISLDNGLYHLDVIEAIATLEALDLRRERIWLDPDLDTGQQTALDTQTEQQRRRRRWINRLCQTVGVIAIIWLILTALMNMAVNVIIGANGL